MTVRANGLMRLLQASGRVVTTKIHRRCMTLSFIHLQTKSNTNAPPLTFHSLTHAAASQRLPTIGPPPHCGADAPPALSGSCTPPEALARRPLPRSTGPFLPRCHPGRKSDLRKGDKWTQMVPSIRDFNVTSGFFV